MDGKVFSVITCSKCKFSLLNLVGLLSLSQFYFILSALIKVAQRKKAEYMLSSNAALGICSND